VVTAIRGSTTCHSLFSHFYFNYVSIWIAPAKLSFSRASAVSSQVTNPIVAKGKEPKSNDVTLIDISYSRDTGGDSLAQYYNQIHGFIFVVDASANKLMKENKNMLADLLSESELKDKPLLM
jgi:hypothetical protein